jgi:polar amino acid transport system substrate-binding protein
MKKHTYSLILALMASVGLQIHACELTVPWEEWVPYQYKDPKGQLAGLDIELVNLVAETAKCKINYVERPWARTLREIASGATHMTPGASINEERQAFAHFSQPYREEVVVLIVRKNESSKFALTKLADMIGLNFRLGTTRDYYHGEDYDALSKNTDFTRLVQEVSVTEQNFHKLKGKRIDGFLVDPVVAKRLAKQLDMGDQIETHPLPIVRDNIYFMFSKASTTQETVEKFNAALQKIKESGQHQAILTNYGL